MRIYIPTYGRSDRQVTWDNLPVLLQYDTHLVVQHRERLSYDNEKYPTIVMPREIEDIGKTRQWLIDTSPSAFIIMFDDDLDFAVRRADEPTKFLPANGRDMINMVDTIRQSLYEGYLMVGVSGREGANYDTSQFKEASRQLRVHAINVHKFRKLGIRFDRLPFMEDFDATLQLLEKGYPNRVLNGWVHNQRGGSNAAGGCSETRTLERHNEAAAALQSMHPKFVRLVQKESGNWGGARTDVNIQWKKAYEYGKSQRHALALDSGAGVGTKEEGSGAAEAVE